MGRAIPEAKDVVLSTCSINRIARVPKKPVHEALAHRVLLDCLHGHGQFKTGFRQFVGVRRSAIFTQHCLARSEKAFDHSLSIEQCGFSSQGILPGVRRAERRPSVRLRTDDNRVTGRGEVR